MSQYRLSSNLCGQDVTEESATITSQYRLSSNLCGLDIYESYPETYSLNTASAVTFVVEYGFTE